MQIRRALQLPSVAALIWRRTVAGVPRLPEIRHRLVAAPARRHHKSTPRRSAPRRRGQRLAAAVSIDVRGDTDTLSRVRVANLVQYLDSIQEK